MGHSMDLLEDTKELFYETTPNSLAIGQSVSEQVTDNTRGQEEVIDHKSKDAPLSAIIMHRLLSPEAYEKNRFTTGLTGSFNSFSTSHKTRIQSRDGLRTTHKTVRFHGILPTLDYEGVYQIPMFFHLRLPQFFIGGGIGYGLLQYRVSLKGVESNNNFTSISPFREDEQSVRGTPAGKFYIGFRQFVTDRIFLQLYGTSIYFKRIEFHHVTSIRGIAFSWAGVGMRFEETERFLRSLGDH